MQEQHGQRFSGLVVACGYKARAVGCCQHVLWRRSGFGQPSLMLDAGYRDRGMSGRAAEILEAAGNALGMR